MNVSLAALAEVCLKEKLREKLLVVSSLAEGHQLLEGLARHGMPWLNLRPVTPLELARAAAEPLLQGRGTELIGEGQSLFLLEETLAQMAGRGALDYFASLSGAEGLGGILYGSVMELRLAGVKGKELEPAHFMDPRKGLEMKELLEGYEAALAQKNWADPPAVYEAALQALGDGVSRAASAGASLLFQDPLYLIPGWLEPVPLEYDFLQALTEGRRRVLPEEPVVGLTRPHGCLFRPESDPYPVSALSLLYQGNEASGAGSPPAMDKDAVKDSPAGAGSDVEISRAYGAANEVRELLRRLKKERIPLDRVMACYTRGTTYIPLFFAASRALEIPVTFGEGVPLAFTRPGRVALNLLRWVEERYSAALLYRLLAGGELQVEQPLALARLLRRAAVGWNRERYLPCLDRYAQSLAGELMRRGQDASEEMLAALQARREQTMRLREIVAGLLASIPAPGPDGLVDFTALSRGLQNIIKEYSRVGGDLDASGSDAVLAALEEAARSSPGLLAEKEALQRLRLRLERLSAGASNPRPGHLHVTGFRSGEAVPRRLTFVVGLESGAFPGSGLQDPVLLDGERKKISPRLVLPSAAPEVNLYRMARFLASRRGRLFLSFSCFDVVEGRASFPSALLLQVYRLQQGDPSADYSRLTAGLPEPAGYLPEKPGSALSTAEWWLYTAACDGAYRADTGSAGSCYPGLAAGIRAMEARTGVLLTPFDGKIDAAPMELDPRLNPDLSCSVSQLETLARCPFAYFMRYVLRIQPPEDYDYDPGAWLDPLTRGTLLHEIYCLFLREFFDPNRTAPPGKERLLEIAAACIEAARDENPPPGEVVFQVERLDLLRGLEVFWRVEVEQGEKIHRAFFEVPFGLGEAEVREAGLGLPGPVVLSLPGDSAISLRGKIDRLDHVGGNRFRVWDYKTGGTFGYAENHFFKQGRQLQHALYAIAAEELLKKSGVEPEAVVETAGYLFPTEKGEGVRLLRKQDDLKRREQAYQVVHSLLELLSGGAFFPAGDKDRCTYCEYTAVCRSPKVTEWLEHKMEHPANAELARWKELQNYA